MANKFKFLGPYTMPPLLFETSTQALILVPLVTGIVFGMLTSTVLIMLVLPAMYGFKETGHAPS